MRTEKKFLVILAGLLTAGLLFGLVGPCSSPAPTPRRNWPEPLVSP